MYKIKVKENSSFIINTNFSAQEILNKYLIGLGIDKKYVSEFIYEPADDALDRPENIYNLTKGAEVLYNQLTTKPDTTIFIMVDSDTDGWTSSAIIISYLRRRFPLAQIKYAMHNGKEHGIDLDIIANVAPNAELIIVPDAGTNDFEQQKRLTDLGKKVIILDHHQINDEEEVEKTQAIIINNQDKRSKVDKNYSGAGVSFLFIQYIDTHYFSTSISIWRNYICLGAVGIIADAMNMASRGTNWFAYWGLRNISNNFIHQLAIKQSHGIKNPEHLTKIDVAFYIAPVINGVIRSGSTEDKEVCFRALITDDSNEIIPSVYRGTNRQETLYEYAARIASNAKSRQDSSKKKAFEMICADIAKNNWDKHNLLIAVINEEESKKINQNITGLVAMELVKQYNKPCLLLRKTNFNNQILLGGSGRNGNFFNMPNLLDFLQKSNLTEYAAGHPNAFGIFLKDENIDKLRNYADVHINGQEFNDKFYEVDYWFRNNETIRTDILMLFAQCSELYGNSIPAPKFAFDIGYDLNQNIMIMGKDSSSLKINHNGVSFVLFKSPDIIEKIKQFPIGQATVIGRAEVNEWLGRKTVQIIIEDIDIHENSSTEHNPAEVDINSQSQSSSLIDIYSLI